jgi:hypothetical protein
MASARVNPIRTRGNKRASTNTPIELAPLISLLLPTEDN